MASAMIPSSQPTYLDPNIEKRILRKLDSTLIPLLWFLFLVSFADRSNIGNARIQGMDTDLNLTGHRYNVAVTAFTIAYVAFGVPANIIVKMCGSSTLAAMMFLWGICALCQALVQTYAQLVVCRFLLGVFEAGFVPGCALLIGSYYTRNEFLKRYTVFFSGAIFAGAFNGFISYLLAKADGKANLAGWRWIFLVEGALTCVVALAAFFLLPAFPAETKMFEGEDKDVLLERLRREDKVEETAPGSSSTKSQIRDALVDWKVWLATVSYIGLEENAFSIVIFLPSILRGLGYSRSEAQIHTIPVYCTALAMSLLCAYVSERVHQRYLFATFGAALNLIGLSMMLGAESLHAKYAATFFITTGSLVAMPILVVWNAINTPREGYRRVVGLALSIAVGNCGAFIGANVFLLREAPRYPTGFGVGMGMTCLAIVSMTALYVGLRISNARCKRDRDHDDELQVSVGQQNKARNRARVGQTDLGMENEGLTGEERSGSKYQL